MCSAAYQAGISGLQLHPFLRDAGGEVITAGFDPGLDPLTMGAKRFLSLAERALCDACQPLAGLPVHLTRSVELDLALPSIRPGFTNEDVETICSGLVEINDLPVRLANVLVSSEGHAAGLKGLAYIVEKIRQGRLRFGIFGGIDSYLHPDTIEWLDDNRQLFGLEARSAFAPGEAAGFGVAMHGSLMRDLNLTPLARVSNVALGMEEKRIKTDSVCLGEGLTATINSALRTLNIPAEKISDIFCDINGERYRSEEWGLLVYALENTSPTQRPTLRQLIYSEILELHLDPSSVCLPAKRCRKGLQTGFVP